APLFRVFSVPTAAYLGKVLNVLLAALGTGLIAWHAARNRLVGEELPVWLAPAVVAGTAIAIPVLATQAVLFSEPLFGVLLAAAVVLADAPPPRLPAAAAACLAGVAAGLGVVWPAARVLFRPLGDLTLGLIALPAIYYLFAAAAVVVGGYGGYLLSRRSSVGWTLVFYFLTLLVWPFPSDRFLWGVLPW